MLILTSQWNVSRVRGSSLQNTHQTYTLGFPYESIIKIVLLARTAWPTASGSDPGQLDSREVLHNMSGSGTQEVVKYEMLVKKLSDY